ncbi:hypothetical protein PF010_g26521 [Phytophthora fragariae]|uniref:RxLR effector protein n=1 Tax=Phytophthora fragariae TaxID=53985 RepID=A0A6G0JX40_9STRA|nr:hypothetical protein PF010_g26521 [Phytophthora fragariae]
MPPWHSGSNTALGKKLIVLATLSLVALSWSTSTSGDSTHRRSRAPTTRWTPSMSCTSIAS